MKILFLRKIANSLGVDKAIGYTSGARVINGFAGILSVFFITTFLTGVEQGFYYTFGSILAMQVFFEMGLTGIMTQFVAHEVSHLSLNEKSEYVGEDIYLSRLASLIQFCVKWYFVLAIIVFVFLTILGNVYFTRYGNENCDVEWKFPWLLICLGTAIKLFQSPFNSILMGIGKVKEMSKMIFFQMIIQPTSVWIGLILGFKLYVVGGGYMFSVVAWQIYVHKTGLATIIINLWKKRVTQRVSYLKEIFPFQWKIALSWVSGYFVSQLFNPVLFATEGAVVAGQMRMTMNALNAIQSFSLSWINTKVPLYSRLIALKDYIQLDKIFRVTLRQMTTVCACLLCIFIFIIWFLNLTQIKFGNSILAERFLPLLPMLFVAFPVYLQQYTNSWATYLRCHKQEPFLIISVCAGVADALSTLILGKYYGLYGLTIGYCLIAIICFPWGYYIYKTKKSDWHAE